MRGVFMIHVKKKMKSIFELSKLSGWIPFSMILKEEFMWSPHYAAKKMCFLIKFPTPSKFSTGIDEYTWQISMDDNKYVYIGKHSEHGGGRSNYRSCNRWMDERPVWKENCNSNCRLPLLHWSCDHGFSSKPSYAHRWTSICWTGCWNGFHDVPTVYLRSFSSKNSRCPGQYQWFSHHWRPVSGLPYQLGLYQGKQPKKLFPFCFCFFFFFFSLYFLQVRKYNPLNQDGRRPWGMVSNGWKYWVPTVSNFTETNLKPSTSGRDFFLRNYFWSLNSMNWRT